MADERSGPNRGWIRNHLMQCTPACSHHRHHHHCQRVPDLENDRVGATLGLQRMHIIGNPSWVPLPITEITFFLLQFLSHLHLRTTHTFPWQDSNTAYFAFVCLFACLFVARIRFVHKPLFVAQPVWQHSVCQARTHPSYRTSPPHCSLLGMLCGIAVDQFN